MTDAPRPERLERASPLGPNGDPTGPIRLQESSVEDGHTRSWADVPWRTIIATICLVGAALLSVLIVYIASRIVIWIAVATFFAIVLARPVGWVQTRFGLRRGASITIVVGLSLALFVGLMALFVMPVRSQAISALTDMPGTIKSAADGRGPFGRLVTKLNLESLVRNNEAALDRAARSVQTSLPGVIGSTIQTALAVITIAVMTCLMLSQSPSLRRTGLRLLAPRHRDLASHVAHDAALAVSGFMIGNLLISLCAGVAAFTFLLIAGVGSPLILALWVAFADLIPLVGATLGAVVAVVAAFFVSPTIGIIAIIFFALYQQFENSVLQLVIMSRTVRVNPLMVLVSVLIGVELFGVIGALLAVPLAGAITVCAKELWRIRPSIADQLIIVGDSAAASGFDTVGPQPKRPWRTKLLAFRSWLHKPFRD